MQGLQLRFCVVFCIDHVRLHIINDRMITDKVQANVQSQKYNRAFWRHFVKISGFATYPIFHAFILFDENSFNSLSIHIYIYGMMND